jgi:hypothetical protein
VCELSRFVCHSNDEFFNYTKDVPGSSMAVDIGAERRLLVDHYCLRHGYNSGYYVLRNWIFEGSNDAEHWHPLKVHTNDTALAEEKFSVAAWPVDTTENTVAYRHFRIRQYQGKDSSWSDGVCCSGIELYGVLEDQHAF